MGDVKVSVDFFWVGFAIFIVGCMFVAHLENKECRARGWTVVEGFWADECEEPKP